MMQKHWILKTNPKTGLIWEIVFPVIYGLYLNWLVSAFSCEKLNANNPEKCDEANSSEKA
jgi:hypothetical protein